MERKKWHKKSDPPGVIGAPGGGALLPPLKKQQFCWPPPPAGPPQPRSCRRLNGPQHIPQPAEINTSLRANPSPRNLDHDRPRPVRSRLAHLADRRHHRHKHGSFLGRQGQPTSPRSLAPGKQILRRDVVPTRDFRYNRSVRVGFRNDPTLVFRPPPAPAPNPNADIDTTTAL